MNSDNYISYRNALDDVAKENGIDEPWDRAIKLLQREQEPRSSIYRELRGSLRSKQSHSLKYLQSYSEEDSRILLLDGEGSFVEVKPHKGCKNAILVTDEVAKLVESDIDAMGGINSIQSPDGNIQILYEKPESDSHLAYEFELDDKGVIHYFCRCVPWECYSAELHARGSRINYVGLEEKTVDTALHWTGFAFWHRHLTPRVMSEIVITVNEQ